MKTVYQIFSRPLRSAVIITTALSALLVIFSIFSVASGSVDESIASVPVIAIFSIITLAVTLTPGLYFRLYSYARFSNVHQRGFDPEILQPTAIVAGIIETINIVFLLNACMAAITSGGVGILGVLAIAAFNIFWLVVWGVIALVLNYRRSTYIPNRTPQKLF